MMIDIEDLVPDVVRSARAAGLASLAHASVYDPSTEALAALSRVQAILEPTNALGDANEQMNQDLRERLEQLTSPLREAAEAFQSANSFTEAFRRAREEEHERLVELCNPGLDSLAEQARDVIEGVRKIDLERVVVLPSTSELEVLSRLAISPYELIGSAAGIEIELDVLSGIGSARHAIRMLEACVGAEDLFATARSTLERLTGSLTSTFGYFLEPQDLLGVLGAADYCHPSSAWMDHYDTFVHSVDVLSRASREGADDGGAGAYVLDTPTIEDRRVASTIVMWAYAIRARMIVLAQQTGGVVCNGDKSNHDLILVIADRSPKFAQELVLAGSRFALANDVIHAPPGRCADGSWEVHESSDFDAFEEAAGALESLLARVAESRKER